LVLPAAAPSPVWWTPPDDRMREKLSRWCATVGPVVVHDAPAAPSTLPMDRVVIVSWNLHVGGGDVDRLIAGLRAGEFTGGESVNGFVLLLQEAYRADEAIPVRLARDLPAPSRIAMSRGRGPSIDHFWRDDRLAVFYAPSMRNGFVDVNREDRGNAIVSTLRLERPSAIELPLERQRRVALAATVAGRTLGGKSWRLRVVDVHLDTALALFSGGPFEARRRQAEALTSALAATRDDAAATTIVAGDFNTWGGRERALDLIARAFPNAPSLTEPTWRGPLGMHATLDHVFAAGPGRVSVRRLPDRFGSDHYPLIAVVAF
jgi:endonuclease/exonuclease/phosphatase family metal-dependent hydrolase